MKYVLRHRRILVYYREAQRERKGLAYSGCVFMLNLYSCNAEFGAAAPPLSHPNTAAVQMYKLYCTSKEETHF